MSIATKSETISAVPSLKGPRNQDRGYKNLFTARRLPTISLIVMAGALWAAVFYWVPATLHMPLGRDQGICAWVGSVILRGGLPYADAWEVKGPAVHFLYAAALFLFGEKESAIRSLDLCMWALSAGAFALLSRGLTGRLLPGLLGMPLFLYLARGDFWQAAQPDLWASILLISSLACLIGLPLHRWRYVWAGFFVGVAALMKPFYGGFLLVLLLQAWFEGANVLKKAAWQLVVGTATLTGAVVTLYAWHHHVPELIDVMLRFNPRVHVTVQHPVSLLQGVSKFVGQTLLTPSAGYPLLAVLVALGWLRIYKRNHRAAAITAGIVLIVTAFMIIRSGSYGYVPYWVFNTRVLLEALALIGWSQLYHRNRRGAMVVASGVLAGVGFVFVQNKFYGYHYTPFWVFIALLAAMGCAAVVGVGSQDERGQGLKWVAGSISVGWVLWLTLSGIIVYAVPYWHLRNGTLTQKRYQDLYCSSENFCHESLQEAATFVRAHTRPDEKMYLWGFDALVYFLADRQAPTRFGNLYPLVADAPEAQRLERDELMRDLCKQPPAMFLVQTHDAINLTVRSSDELLKEFPALERLLVEHYRLRMQNSDVAVYELDRSTMGTFCLP